MPTASSGATRPQFSYLCNNFRSLLMWWIGTDRRKWQVWWKLEGLEAGKQRLLILWAAAGKLDAPFASVNRYFWRHMAVGTTRPPGQGPRLQHVRQCGDSLTKHRPAVSVSWGCCGTLPQTYCLNITWIYYLVILSPIRVAAGLISFWRLEGDICSLAFSSF